MAGARILIQHEDAAVLENLYGLLTYRTGYECARVESAGETLAALVAERFDLAVCGTAGWGDGEFERVTRRVAVVICTRRQDPAVYLRFREMGAREILLQPFGREHLLKVVRKVMGERPSKGGLLPV